MGFEIITFAIPEQALFCQVNIDPWEPGAGFTKLSNPKMNLKYCFLTIGFVSQQYIGQSHLILGGLHESSPRFIKMYLPGRLNSRDLGKILNTHALNCRRISHFNLRGGKLKAFWFSNFLHIIIAAGKMFVHRLPLAVKMYCNWLLSFNTEEPSK